MITFWHVVILLLLMALLTLVSYVDRVFKEAGKFLSREFQENIDYFESNIEPKLGRNPQRAALAMAVLPQMLLGTIAFLMAYTVFSHPWSGLELLQAALVLVFVIVICSRLVPYLLFARTRGEWAKNFVWLFRLMIYLAIPVTIMLGFTISVAALAKENAEEEPEHPSEAVDALIEAGTEEGILEESDRHLIQSVVEFGDKTVREVMTPRPRIFAVPTDWTLEQLTDALRDQGYSRIPVFRGSIDNLVGIVFSRDLLQIADTDARTRKVGDLVREELMFVPETKRGSELLREMQRDNVRMAVVIDEYGSVAGLVTIEDLIEEIVGELRDEDETDIVKEGEHTYVVPGSMDVDRLNELFGVRVDEDHESSTVAGLVSEIAGRIPQPGEVVENLGLRFEVLASTDRRIERLRISEATQTPDQVQA
ncbi:CBS domain protein [Candidatus Koribacter versatilis Ellin345]|uniref:CBS domain protein n=1 Tax=Koribacter versatilis (strain Ellin345) TaxID=204669 RepID=Q1IKR3_KORVE|nr:hemolysin family protein [Candidatus Koribacter versatilis]ABF42537.1 CBS domain protein [Candidatus Koribacter versatilis Ellin345]